MRKNCLSATTCILWLGAVSLLVPPKTRAQAASYSFDVTFCNQTSERLPDVGATDEGTGLYLSANGLASGIAAGYCLGPDTCSGCGGDWTVENINPNTAFQMGDTVTFSATGVSGTRYLCDPATFYLPVEPGNPGTNNFTLTVTISGTPTMNDNYDFPPCPTGCSGMPVRRVSEPYETIWLLDEPLGYQPSIGSRISLTLGYKQRESTAGMNPGIFSLGRLWNFSWLSYVTHDPFGSNVVYFPGGGSRTFEGTVDYLTSTSLTGNMAEGYTLYYPDGSIDVYNHIENDMAFLTSHSNPQSQTTTFNYNSSDSGIQLLSVVDATGGTTTITYVASNQFSPNLISQVTDRYGRSAYFAYNTNGCLTNIVDVGGITNSFSYNTNYWITLMTTPYGPTTFQLQDTPPGESAPNGRSVLITDPDGSSELYLATNDAAGVEASFSAVPNTSPLPNLFDTNNLNVRDTFHWGKMQYANLSTTNSSLMSSNDFHKATLKHWLLTASNEVEQTLSVERDPSPDVHGATEGQIRWYDYAGKTNSEYEGTQFLPLLTAVVLPNGNPNFTWNARNSLGAVATNITTYSSGGTATALRTNILTYATNAIDVISVTNAMNVQVASNSFNAYHEVLNHYDALNELTTFTYDTSNRLLTTTTPTLLVISNSYGITDGYLAQRAAIGFNTNSYTYADGLVSTHTDPRGLTVTNTWDSLQRLTSTTYPDGTFTSNVYTILDCTATMDRLSNWTHYGYDSMRRNISITNALTNYELFHYCGCGALEIASNALLEPTYYNYDNQARLTNVLYPDNYTVTYNYNLIGELTNYVDGAGISITNTFNNQGGLTQSSNAAGQIRSIAYDILDRPTNVVDGNGVAVSLSYDNLNRLLSRTYPDTGTEDFGYSAFGLVAYTNQLSNRTYYRYDAALRKIAETNALTPSGVTQFAYDPANDLTNLTDQNNHTTRWGYDIYGRVTNKVDAIGATILEYDYDADNRLTNRWSIAKTNTTYAYDKVGNLTNVTYQNGQQLNYGYNAMNWMTSMSDAIGTTSFTYTQVGQLSSETGPWGDDTVSNIYTDRLRTTLSLQQPEAAAWVQDYGYDLAGRMTTLSSLAGSFSYAYNPGVGGVDAASGLIAKVTLPNSAWISNTFDNNGRILGTWLTNGSSNIDSTVYTYNVGNQRLTATRTGENTATYGYDAIGQVVSDTAAEVSGGANRYNEQLSYGFDPAGNLLHRTNNLLIASFTVNSNNFLTSNTNGGRLTVVGTTTYIVTNVTVTVNGSNASVYKDATFAATNMPLASSYTAVAQDSLGRHSTNTVNVTLSTNNTAYAYDGNGNLLYDGLRTFAYDSENQLIQVMVTNGPNAWLSQFTYDGKMRRRIRQEFASTTSGTWTPTNTVYYVYDGNVVIQERAANNQPTTTYTRGLDLSSSAQGAGGIGGLLAMTLNTALGPTSSNSYYYHADGNGNVTMLINGSQFPVAKYLYDSFGNVLSAAGSMAQQNLYRFSSKEAHPISGLLYYYYRYYDPNLQRWINRDPESELQEANLFRFANNSSVNYLDKYGLQPCEEDQLEFDFASEDVFGMDTEEELAEEVAQGMAQQILQAIADESTLAAQALRTPESFESNVNNPPAQITATVPQQLILELAEEAETTAGILSAIARQAPQSAGPGAGPASGPQAQSAFQNALAAESAGTTRFVSTARGIMDTQPTLQRIACGGSFPHPNDGSIFENRENLLPPYLYGYYNEYVAPTPGVNGPGGMRIVTGLGGEVYFTPNHYQTFVPLNP